jgi:branched-chain amino acid aminotransferase
MIFSSAYFNGSILPFEQIAVPANDLALLRGYGIFDFFKTQNGVPLFLKDYIDRFFSSARQMGLELPLSKSEIPDIIHSLQEKNCFDDSGFRLLLSGGPTADGFMPGKANFWILQEQLPILKPGAKEQGGRLISYEFRRDEPGIKSINYQVPVRLKVQGKFGDALDVLYHLNGEISEASRCNFYLIINGEICTPEAGVLHGITRKHILSLASKGFRFKLGPLFMSDLEQAEEAFISSTTKGVQPITQIDDMPIGNGKPGPHTLNLMYAFDDLVKAYCRNK